MLVVAQLVEPSLPNIKILGSNPVISIFIHLSTVLQEQN